MKQLPTKVSFYKKTKVFDEKTIPKGILNSHQTISGVWGRINVIEGELIYIIKCEQTEQVRLDPSTFGVIEPEVTHYVRPIGKVRFYVEFYR